MEHLNYWQFPGFENVYLEDSYVLGIKAQGSVVEILIEAVLTENHPLYTPPLPGEQYCYRKMIIKFPQPQKYTLVNKMMAISGIDGNIDYGNIEEFYKNDQEYYVRGEWGELTIISPMPVMMANHLLLKKGDNAIEIDKDKIKALEWKLEGIVNLVYENESGDLLSIQISQHLDPKGFADVLAYMGELKGGYLTQVSASEPADRPEPITINYAVSSL